MEAHWEASWPTLKTNKDYKTFLEELVAQLPAYHDPFWSYRYTFEVEPKKDPLPLVGKTLKTEALINTFLPLLHESVISRSIPMELDAFIRLFSSTTPQKTGKAAYLKHRFFGDTLKGKILSRADTLQGAYQLHHDFCIHYESSCEGCPFVDRYYKSVKGNFL
jgi:hypothetical protein